MLELLLWFGWALGAVSFIGLFWTGGGQPGTEAGWLLPSLGTLVVEGAGAALAGFAWWAESYGVRPGWFRFAASGWAVSLAGGVLLAVRSRRSGPLPGRWLAAGLAGGLAVALTGYFGLDAGRRAAYEDRLREAQQALERLRPPPVPAGEDARPLYERAAEALAAVGELPGAIRNRPLAAVREHPDAVRRLLEERSEALRIAAEARSKERVSIEPPNSILSEAFVAQGEEGGPYWLLQHVATLARLLGLDARLAAQDGDVAAVEDRFAWLARIAAQLRPAPDAFAAAIVQGIESLRLRLVEDVLALLGPSSAPPRVRLPLVSEERRTEHAERLIRRESEWAVYNALLLWLGKVDPEQVPERDDVDSDLGPVLWSLTAEWMRLYRVFVLPADLRAIEAHTELALEDSRSRAAGGSPRGMLDRIREAGAGPMSGLLLPGLDILARGHRRSSTAEEVARTALAVAAWRAAEGEYPERLDALVSERLEAVPRDAVRGLPLGYERLDDGTGAVVFSRWDPYGRRSPGGEPPEASWQELLRRSEALVVFLGTARDRHREDEPFELPEELREPSTTDGAAPADAAAEGPRDPGAGTEGMEEATKDGSGESTASPAPGDGGD